MAKKIPAQYKKFFEKLEAIRQDFYQELARLKAERMDIIRKINRKADDKKIQAILKNIK